MPSTVLITGCSTGFGRDAAQLFLDRGWNVVATMRTPQPDSFEAHDRLLVTALDVTDQSTIEAALAAATERFGQIDVLVNNAGIGLAAPFEVTPDEAIRRIFETNTFGLMAACRAVIPAMRERGSGTIINVTSSVTISPLRFVPVYTASKSAVEGLSEALFHELGSFGIKVKLVEPGLAPSTSFGQNARSQPQPELPDFYAERLQGFIQSMHTYPYEYTTGAHVAEAIFQAATDGTNKLRYPAGPDAGAIAELRRTLPEGEFLAKIGTVFAG